MFSGDDPSLFFNENDKLGATINLSKLYQSVMSLGYIDSIKTVYYNNKNNYIRDEMIAYCNGFSFAKFTKPIINCNDFEQFNQYFVLEKFQYPTLLNAQNLFNLINITSENIFSIKNNEF